MKHALSRPARKGAVVVLGAAIIGIGGLASPASAGGHDWTGVAQCESSGNWHINTGNGYYGGLQFSPSTWTGYGGGAYASRADLATPAQQIAVAERVLAGQGIGAWPTCGRRLTGGSTPAPAPVAPSAPVVRAAPAVLATPVFRAAPAFAVTTTGGTYSVRPGDTLSGIAATHGMSDWRALWALNSATVDNPDVILVGQTLRV